MGAFDFFSWNSSSLIFELANFRVALGTTVHSHHSGMLCVWNGGSLVAFLASIGYFRKTDAPSTSFDSRF
jgi:hypothetical protein